MRRAEWLSSNLESVQIVQKVASYNVAKSFYQTHPDVFNLKRVSEVTGIEIDEVNLAFKGCMMIAF